MYAIISDVHCHKWSSFSHTNQNGVNSRLQIIIDEIHRACSVLRKAGGNEVVIAGDLFHTRGTIDPEVLNPVRAAFEQEIANGITFRAIPGNHDLMSNDTQELSSAIQNLHNLRVDGSDATFIVHNETIGFDGFGFVPWHPSNEALLDELEKLKDQSNDPSSVDVFIHAGIEGVLPNMPGSGLTDKKLAAFGFRHIFAGHYHNHKVMSGGVVSIGATTHQNWGDVDTKAGFLIVDDNGGVTYHASQAPSFVDVSSMNEVDMALVSDGNYVRFRGPEMTPAEVKALREQFEKWGAKGVSIQAPPAASNTRGGTAPPRGTSLAQSISHFIDNSKTVSTQVDKAKLSTRAHQVLNDAQTVSD